MYLRRCKDTAARSEHELRCSGYESRGRTFRHIWSLDEIAGQAIVSKMRWARAFALGILSDLD
jgi:hypothetical protein